MKAVHIINHRVDGRFHRLETEDASRKIYSSRSWVFSQEDAEGLVGGWIYLHEVKNKPSEFGGRILEVLPGSRDQGAIADGWVFVFEARKEGRGQHWRGNDYDRAWTGYPVEANYSHEGVEARAESTSP